MIIIILLIIMMLRMVMIILMIVIRIVINHCIHAFKGFKPRIYLMTINVSCFLLTAQSSTAAATPLQPVTPFTAQPNSTAATAMMPSAGPITNINNPPPSYNFASRYPAPKDGTIPSYENAVYHPSPVYVATNTASPHPGGATGVSSYEGATYHPAPAIGGSQANPQPAPYPTYHPPPVSSPYGSLVPPTGVAPSPLVHAPPPSGVEAPPPPFTGNAPPVMPPPPMGATAPPPPPSYNQAVQ